MTDHDDLFAQAMSQVKVISAADKVRKKKKQPRPNRDLEIKSPVIQAAPSHSHLAAENTDNPWILKASGISQERLKKLAGGSPVVRRDLDLHGFTRDEALVALEEFVEQALVGHQRAIEIIHGRGLHSQGKAVLKECVYHWLRQGRFSAHILAAIPTPSSGGGSCRVLLRKQS
ncbi:MAG: Smr/MutS family protein [Mariprofundaceae bacterium]